MRSLIFCAVAMLAIGAAAQADTLYALDWSGNLYTVNTTTAAATFVGASGIGAMFGLSDTPDGELWAYDQFSGNMVRLNRSTGAVEQTIGGYDFGIGEGSIAFDSTGTGYATQSSGNVGTFWRFDLLGNSVLVDANLDPSMDGLDFTTDDRLFGKAQGNGDSYIINTANGDTTFNVALADDPNILSGFTFDSNDIAWFEADGVLHHDLFGPVGTITGLRDAISGMSFAADQAPEPFSLALLGVAGVFVARRRRKA